MKIEFDTKEVHPVETAKSAVKIVGKGMAATGEAITHASVASVTSGAAELAGKGMTGFGRVLSKVGRKLQGK